AVAGEETALDHLHQLRLFGAQTLQELVQGEELLDLRLDGNLAVVERYLLHISAAFLALSPASVVDDHLTHGGGGDGEEVIAVLPVRPGLVDQLQVRLVDEASGIQGAGRSPVTELPARNPAQLGVNERHQLIECTGPAFAVGDQNGRDAFSCRHDGPRLPG